MSEVRLIDAEVLKKAITLNRNIDRNAVCDVLDIIDTAPTVDLWEMRQEATENALKKTEVLYKRPQGEWIDHSEDYGYVECPVCEHLTTCEGNKDELHYCWYCGSRMGKGGTE